MKKNQQLEHSKQGEEWGDGVGGRQEPDRVGLTGSDNKFEFYLVTRRSHWSWLAGVHNNLLYALEA